jgi:antitoxin component of MazEF toxin-antitoxin module
MIKRLVKHGNGWALIIDKEIMKALKINESSALELDIDSLKKTLVLKPSENMGELLSEVNKDFKQD